MNLLNKARVYLSGPIDYAPDLGKKWREEFISLSKEKNLGLHIINPCDKPLICEHEISGEQKMANFFKKTKDWEGLRNFVKNFRRQDLRFTDIADFLVIYVNKNIHMCGSYNELFVAESQKKPIFCIVEGGIENLPTWLFGVFKINHIFDSVEKCVNHLEVINNQKEPLDNCWVLVGQHLD